jgi:hypothetical protein
LLAVSKNAQSKAAVGEKQQKDGRLVPTVRQNTVTAGADGAAGCLCQHLLFSLADSVEHNVFAEFRAAGSSSDLNVGHTVIAWIRCQLIRFPDDG